MKRILFQGDSITDSGRDRENHIYVGYGYPVLVKSQLGYDYPCVYDFQNRGVNGNRSVDVYARIKADIINLKPDYMSILVGVNDVASEIDNANGVDADKYEKIYSMLIEEVMTELPDIKIMIMEPFCLGAGVTENNADPSDKWSIYCAEVTKRAQKAKAVAEKYNLCFVPLQEKFNEMVKNTEDTYWFIDGVHPTAAGHELIAREWLKAFSSLK